MKIGYCQAHFENFSLTLRIFFYILLFSVYFITAKIGLQFAFANSSVTAIWPPTGIALAIILLLGYKKWPIIFLGALFVNYSLTHVFFSSILISIGNTLEAVAGVYLFYKFAHIKKETNLFNTFKNTTAYL